MTKVIFNHCAKVMKTNITPSSDGRPTAYPSYSSPKPAGIRFMKEQWAWCRKNKNNHKKGIRQ